MAAKLSTKKPTIRRISVRGIVTALAGPEPAYPVYQWGRNAVKFERPKHNPFLGL